MKKTIEFLVSVDVAVPDGKEIFCADIADGIQMGINYMTNEGELTGEINSHVKIGPTSTTFLPTGMPFAKDVAVTAAFFNEGTNDLVNKEKLHCHLQTCGVAPSAPQHAPPAWRGPPGDSHADIDQMP